MHRRHDIDALRAGAFALVIVYHVGMYYVAGWHWHLKSPHAAAWLQLPMVALNLWRMDLVFLVSGLAFAILRRSRTPGALARERSLRLLLPLAFGMAVVVPYQPYAQGVANGLVAPGFGDFLLRYYGGSAWPRGAFDGWEHGVTWNHLWYLAYLWVYTVVLAALLPVLDRLDAAIGLRRRLVGLRGSALLLLPAVPLALYALVLQPRFPATHDLLHDGWLHAQYATLFLYGYWIGLDEGVWAEAVSLRWRSLGLALGLLALHLMLRGMPAAAAEALRPLWRVLACCYLWAMVLAILGFAHRHLNRPWPWLAWANASVYPWYLLHQTLIIVLIVQLAPLGLGPVAEPALLLTGTVAGCALITAGVQRVRWLRPLFGLPRQAARAHEKARLGGGLVGQRAGR